MKAKDLRIGNLVYLNNKLFAEKRNIPFVVEEIIGTMSPQNQIVFPNSTGGVTIKLASAVASDVFSGTIVYNQFDEFIEPIPLTEAWLTIFGFIKRDVGTSFPNFQFYLDILDEEDELILRTSYEGGFYWGITGEKELRNVRPIKYVHQLQNLFHSLTEEELKFNN